MKANKFAKNDEGVSAVIGVILMVAITVILAAVIAAFVFGMVGNVGTKKNPAFTVKRTSATVVQVTLNDLGGATTINHLSETQPIIAADLTAPNEATAMVVGQTVNINNFPTTTSHLVLTAQCDGNVQVVVDTSV